MSEKIEPCPFCSAECGVPDGERYVGCSGIACGYSSAEYYIAEEAIAAHNQLCRRVKLGEMAEDFAETNYSEPTGMDESYLDGYHTAWYTAQRIFQYAIESEDDDASIDG